MGFLGGLRTPPWPETYSALPAPPYLYGKIFRPFQTYTPTLFVVVVVVAVAVAVAAAVAVAVMVMVQ